MRDTMEFSVLETFLVEWKHVLPRSFAACRPALETFLVEWKRRFLLCRRLQRPNLETFLSGMETLRLEPSTHVEGAP